MKKVLCVVLVMCLMASVMPSAFAEQPDESLVSPRLVAISACSADIAIDENTGIASCDAQCLAKGTYAVKVVCKLQRWNGSSWVTLKTWTSTDSYYAYVTENWAVYKGYTYRVYATFYVYDANGTLLETVSAYDSQSYT